MSTRYTEVRGEAMGIDPRSSAPSDSPVDTGRMYVDTSTGKLYIFDGTVWRSALGGTSTSTSTTSTSSSSSSTSSTSSSSSSTSTTSSSTSSTSSSTSTTLF